MSTPIANREASVHHIKASEECHAYLRPAFPLHHRLMRQAWKVVWLVLYRPTPVGMFAWRASLLRLFGATIGTGCKFYPAGRVWAPWNLECADNCEVADGAEIYNPSHFRMGTHAILSEHAYVCGATHEYDDPDFPMISYPMQMGAYTWVCARASLGPGVMMDEGSVLGLGSVAMENLEPWTIYMGAPAKKVKTRQLRSETE